MEVVLPAWLESSGIVARVLTPDGDADEHRVKAEVRQIRPGAVAIDLTGLIRYASVVLEPGSTGG
jgi:hypothetical protein